jgi:hypothetical protein
VAERTIRAQATLVMLVAVTGRAIQRRTLEQQRAMALLARHDGVAPDQRKPRDVVIEGNYPSPADLSVASLATDAELALVPIILAVTRYAGRRQLVAIEIAGMARIALDLRVRPSQGIFRGFVMIEVNRAPLVLVVAGLALGAVPCGVNILNPVAIDAHGTNSLVAFADMARRAGDGTMGAVKRELGLVVVVRLDARPCCLGMAVVAHFPKSTLVRIDRLVTVEAAPRRVAELYLLGMTTATLHRFVSVVQLEIRECMIECFAVELDDVGISPLVIGVTMGAFLFGGIRLSSVKPLARRPISGGVLVARQT